MAQARRIHDDVGRFSKAGKLSQVRGLRPGREFTRKRIMEPLKMRDSFLVDDPASPLRSRVAAAYQRRDSTWVRYMPVPPGRAPVEIPTFAEYLFAGARS